MEAFNMKSSVATSSGTVQRVVEILKYFGEAGDTTIKELSAVLGLVPSTCHRMLDLLSKEGLVERDDVKRGYRVGPEFYRIAALVHSRQDVRRLARPILQQVVDACDETCVLGLYLPREGRMIFAEKVDSSHLLRYQLPMNSQLSVLWGASGQSIIAFLPQAETDKIYASSGPAPASKEPPPSRTELESILVSIRERGYAVSSGQKIAGAVGINAPVFDVTGRVIGCLGVTVPEQRITSTNVKKLGELVRQHARALSEMLGAPVTTNTFPGAAS